MRDSRSHLQVCGHAVEEHGRTGADAIGHGVRGKYKQPSRTPASSTGPCGKSQRQHLSRASNISSRLSYAFRSSPRAGHVVSGRGGVSSVPLWHRGESAGDDWNVLTNEMKRFAYAIGPSGGISYSAPSGYHDDCVIALALANHRRWETENVGRMLAVTGGDGRRSAVLRKRERVLWG